MSKMGTCTMKCKVIACCLVLVLGIIIIMDSVTWSIVINEATEKEINNQYDESPVNLDGYQQMFEQTYTPHAPIIITNNADFPYQDWPGNGTEDNPYVIQGFSFTDSVTCISIINTDVYFTIRDCSISTPIPSTTTSVTNPSTVTSATSMTTLATEASTTGIRFDNVTHGCVEQCIIELETYGVYLTFTNSCTLVDNIITDSMYGINLGSSHNCILTDNTVTGSSSGFYLSSSDDCVLTNNMASNNGDGFKISGSNGCVFTKNTASNNDGSGFIIWLSESCIFTKNTALYNKKGFYRTGDGFDISESHDCVLTNNTCWYNGHCGFDIRQSDSCFLKNMIHTSYCARIRTGIVITDNKDYGFRCSTGK